MSTSSPSAPATPETVSAFSSRHSHPHAQPYSRPDRPFSPSPPRSTRHTASRPPSFFLGAALPSASISSPELGLELGIPGLPHTPERGGGGLKSPSISTSSMDKYKGLSRHELADDLFGSEDRRSRTGSVSKGIGGSGQIGEVNRTMALAEMATSRDSLSMVRSLSDSTSTTSSSSPPLGSTSILSALANADSPSGPTVIHDRIRNRHSSQSRHNGRGDTTPPDAFPAIPSSPQSAKSTRTSFSHPSSIPSSRSMPRLHQPTVIRSASGRGVAFLPAQSTSALTSSTSTSTLGRPRTRTSRASMPPGSSSQSVFGGTSSAATPWTPSADEDGEERRRRTQSYFGERGSGVARPGSYFGNLGAPISIPSRVPNRPSRAESIGTPDEAVQAIVEKGVITVNQGREVDASEQGEVGEIPSDDSEDSREASIRKQTELGAARGEDTVDESVDVSSAASASEEESAVLLHPLPTSSDAQDGNADRAGAEDGSVEEGTGANTSGTPSVSVSQLPLPASGDGGGTEKQETQTTQDEASETAVPPIELAFGPALQGECETEVKETPQSESVPISSTSSRSQTPGNAEAVQGSSKPPSPESITETEVAHCPEPISIPSVSSSSVHSEAVQEPSKTPPEVVPDMGSLPRSTSILSVSSASQTPENAEAGKESSQTSPPESTSETKVAPRSERASFPSASSPSHTEANQKSGKTPPEGVTETEMTPRSLSSSSVSSSLEITKDAQGVRTSSDTPPSEVKSETKPIPRSVSVSSLSSSVRSPEEEESVQESVNQVPCPSAGHPPLATRDHATKGRDVRSSRPDETHRDVDDEMTLHEITDDEHADIPEAVDSGKEGSVTTAISPMATNVYTPPYRIRKSIYRPSNPLPALSASSSTEERTSTAQGFAITLLAGISRQSRTDPLSLTIPHLELFLTWAAEPTSFLWVPARRYIPSSVDVHLVRGGKEVVLRQEGEQLEEVERRRGLIRGLVGVVVGRMPIVWRFAHWI